MAKASNKSLMNELEEALVMSNWFNMAAVMIYTFVSVYVAIMYIKGGCPQLKYASIMYAACASLHLAVFIFSILESKMNKQVRVSNPQLNNPLLVEAIEDPC